jgi:hypothetical protein
MHPGIEATLSRLQLTQAVCSMAYIHSQSSRFFHIDALAAYSLRVHGLSRQSPRSKDIEMVT